MPRFSTAYSVRKEPYCYNEWPSGHALLFVLLPERQPNRVLGRAKATPSGRTACDLGPPCDSRLFWTCRDEERLTFILLALRAASNKEQRFLFSFA